MTQKSIRTFISLSTQALACSSHFVNPQWFLKQVNGCLIILLWVSIKTKVHKAVISLLFEKRKIYLQFWNISYVCEMDYLLKIKTSFQLTMDWLQFLLSFFFPKRLNGGNGGFLCFSNASFPKSLWGAIDPIKHTWPGSSGNIQFLSPWT